eukprot:m.179937 g.179937  ORF g.179937 m.179937 type:complete len:110 (-) comp10461_c0_seq19:23-352(-)
MLQLLEYEGDDVADVFGFTFEISHSVFGEVVEVELKPGGADIDVTNENRDEFVKLYVNYLLTDSVSQQFEAFHRGFHLVCGGIVLPLFRPDELELLICGRFGPSSQDVM